MRNEGIEEHISNIHTAFMQMSEDFRQLREENKELRRAVKFLADKMFEMELKIK